MPNRWHLETTEGESVGMSELTEQDEGCWQYRVGLDAWIRCNCRNEAERALTPDSHRFYKPEVKE